MGVQLGCPRGLLQLLLSTPCNVADVYSRALATCHGPRALRLRWAWSGVWYRLWLRRRPCWGRRAFAGWLLKCWLRRGLAGWGLSMVGKLLHPRGGGLPLLRILAK